MSAPGEAVTLPPSGRLRAVTYDCWQTLLVDREPGVAMGMRARALAAAVGVELERAEEALRFAWSAHDEAWRRVEAFGAGRMAQAALADLGVTSDPALVVGLADVFEAVSVDVGVRAVDGAAEALAGWRARGVRTALVCDTGFTPGKHVRRMLDSVGLLALLDAFAFSDEVGVPKPDAAMFVHALGELGGIAPADAVHVGDLRRTDVGGARAHGMGTARYRGAHDDSSEGPEADVVLDDHLALLSAIPAG